jgi:hypothetical protein
VPGSGGRRRRGALIIHRGPLPATDITTKHGIPVTTPTRTLIDLADVLPRRRLERALDEAAYRRLDVTDLQPRPGRRGSRALAQALTRHDPGATRTRSDLEERMLRLLHRFRLHTPEVNATIERDRRRDADLLAAGWRVLRVSYARLERDPAWVAQRIAEALRA